jgi:GT2 family glycosyltransferase
LPSIDVVVVSYNSRAKLRACLEPLAGADGVNVIVVDNASNDDTVGTIADLPVKIIPLRKNSGFGAGCNVGWRSSSSSYVLFLNPDARISPAAVHALAQKAEELPGAAALGPKLVTPSGELDYSVRHFPRLRSTYARALFLHRLVPRASWVDEVIRDPRAYVDTHVVDWVTGACLLVRRAALEEVGGFDERFFMYCEDKDLCARLWEAGHAVAYEPSVVCEHEGGAGSEAASDARRSMLTRSRLLYAATHSTRPGVLLESLGLALEATVRLVTGPGGLRGRRARLDELRVILESLRADGGRRGGSPPAPAGGYPIG